MKNNYGVEVIKFHIIRVKPGGASAADYEAAATKAFKATNEAKSICILAEAERDRIGKVYGKIKEFDELGQIIRRLESLEKAAAGPGNIIIAAPELMALASSVMQIGQQRPTPTPTTQTQNQGG